MLVVLENIRWVWGLPCVGRAAYRHGVSRDDHVGLGVTTGMGHPGMIMWVWGLPHVGGGRPTGMGHPGMIMWVWGLPRVGGAAYRHGASRDDHVGLGVTT